MNKPKPSSPKSSSLRPLVDVLRKTLTDAFAKQGFASVELVTRWPEIVGAEIAAHSQPEKIQWPRTPQAKGVPEPGTLLLRVEGPAAVEIQHLSGVILERVKRGNVKPPRQINKKVPPPLEAVCLKAMAKAPGRRYATARELADAGSGVGPVILSAVTAVAGLAAGIVVSGSVGFAAAAALWKWAPEPPGRIRGKAQAMARQLPK